MNAGTIYLALPFGTAVTVTILISYRILQTHWLNQHGEDESEVANVSRLYYKIIEIVVESAVLYSVSALVLLILLVRKEPTYVYAVGVVSQVTVRSRLISPLHTTCKKPLPDRVLLQLLCWPEYRAEKLGLLVHGLGVE